MRDVSSPTRLSSNARRLRLRSTQWKQCRKGVGFCEMTIVAPVSYARHEFITSRFGWPAGLSSEATGNSGGRARRHSPPTAGNLQDK